MNCPAAEEFFNNLTPDEVDSILTIMCETAHDFTGYYNHPEVTVLSRDRIDMINVMMHGILHWDDEEYPFVLEDGNRNGTVIQEFGEGNWEYEEPRPTVWKVGYINFRVPKTSDEAAFMLKKLKLFETRSDVQDIIRKFSYDHYVQPGIKTDQHYDERAKRLGFRIVPESVQQDMIEQLKARVEERIDG